MIRGSGGGVCPLCRKPFRDMTAVKKLHVDTFEDTLSAEVERERVERAVERAVHAREKEAAEKEREVLAKLVAGQDVEDQEVRSRCISFSCSKLTQRIGRVRSGTRV